MDRDQEKETKDLEQSDIAEPSETTQESAPHSTEDMQSALDETSQENPESDEPAEDQEELGQKDVNDLSDLFDDEESVLQDEASREMDTAFQNEQDEKSEEVLPEASTTPSTPHTPIAKLPIEISLEVGTHLISLEDLLEMKEGTVLELGETLSDELRLLVDGHCIGRAEVVKIGEKVGIRILDLIQPSKP